MAPKTKNPEVEAEDEVPNGIILLATHLKEIRCGVDAIVEQMIERTSLLRNVGEGAAPAGKADTGDLHNVFARIEKLEGIVGGIPARMDELTALVKGIPALLAQKPTTAEVRDIEGMLREVPVVEPKPAPTNGAIVAAPVAEATTPVKRGRGRPADPAKCPHPADKVETLENGLRRCTRCGAVLEAQVEKPAPVAAPEPEEIAEKAALPPPPKPEEKKSEPASAPTEEVYRRIDGKIVQVDPVTLEPIAPVAPEPAKVEEKKPEPKPVEEKPAPAPEPKVEEQKASIDDVRAVAIGYANKHGKDKLGEVLRKYGQGNLSSVPTEHYRTLMVELQNGSK